ncbi:MAG: pilus assembly protein PilP [Bdellovibrionales bacterium]|nr:pilus assembly protein PilP [Bdellovibrionales bacterium]
MASVGLWVAFFMSLKFMTPGHTQTPPAGAGAQKMEPPSPGDLPPEFMQETQQAPQGGGNIPPPPTQPPQVPANAEAAPPPPPPNVPPAAGGTPPMVPATAPGSVAPPPPMESSVPIVPQFASDDQYTYDPTGRRDPFKPYRTYRPTPTNTGPAKMVDMSDPLQRWDLDRFNVVAIMWEIRHPKAMVKDPDGKMYMIGKSTKIGRNSGQVVAIREGEIVVVETIENEGVQTKEVKILELKK